MQRPMVRSDHEVHVDQTADRLSYLLLSFGLLAVVAYRSFARSEASWDLLGLVILSGVFGMAYRVRERAVSREWTLLVGATVVVAAVAAIILAVVTRS